MKGDHLYIHKHLRRFPYTHHGIDCGDDSVIHYGKSKNNPYKNYICRVSKSRFSSGKKIFVEDKYIISYPPDLAIKRAKIRLGEASYDLFSNNCEHFVRWCKCGAQDSEQVNRFSLCFSYQSIFQQKKISRLSEINANLKYIELLLKEINHKLDSIDLKLQIDRDSRLHTSIQKLEDKLRYNLSFKENDDLPYDFHEHFLYYYKIILKISNSSYDEFELVNYQKIFLDYLKKAIISNIYESLCYFYTEKPKIALCKLILQSELNLNYNDWAEHFLNCFHPYPITGNHFSYTCYPRVYFGGNLIADSFIRPADRDFTIADLSIPTLDLFCKSEENDKSKTTDEVDFSILINLSDDSISEISNLFAIRNLFKESIETLVNDSYVAPVSDTRLERLTRERGDAPGVWQIPRSPQNL